jgi:hypothetical protein
MLDFIWNIFRRIKKEEECEDKSKDFLILKEEEIEKYVNSITKTEEDKILKEAQNFILSINEKLLNFEKSLSTLEQENISLPDKQIEKVVTSKKHEFLEKMRRTTEKIKSVDISNFESFYRTYDEALNALREVNAISLKEFLTIKNYFSNSREVFDKFKDLFENFYSFQDRIKSDKVSEIFDIKKTLSDYNWIKKEIFSKNREKEEIANKIEEKRKEIEKKKKELLDLENSEDMVRLSELQKEKMKISYREKELASICVERFSKVEYIFKKVKRHLENSGLKESKILSEFIASPFDVTISKDFESILEFVLDYMKKSNFSQEEITKIESLVEEKFFSSLKAEYDELEKRLHEIENEIEKIDIINKKLRIENEIKSLEFELSEMEKKARAIDEKISELELLLPKLKESLENKISKISGKESKILS